MNIPFFIAETPRAGPFGHCFIVPPGPVANAARLDEFCHVATQHDTGANFVAVRRDVEQRLPTGTVRMGVEILLLVGVDYPQLTAAQKQQLVVILRQRLADLEQLIAHIAWAQERQGLRVIRKEFTEWVQTDHLAEFPLAQSWDRPLLEAPRVQLHSPAEQFGTLLTSRKKEHNWWRRVGTMASLIMVLILGGVITTWLPDFWRPFRSPEPPSPQRPCSNLTTFECFTHTLKTLADACGQPYEKFVSALHRTLLPDKTSVVDADQKQKELYNEPKVWDAVVEQYYRREKIKPYTFLDDNRIIAALFRDIFSEESSDIQAILAVRRHIAELGKVFAALHTPLVTWGVDKLPHDGPFAEVLRYMQSLPCAACEHLDPIFPFLAKSDQEVIGVFHTLFVYEGTPLRKALPAQSYEKLYGPERTLRSILLALAAYAPQIRREVQAEKDRAEDPHQDDATLAQRTRAYTHLLLFFDRMGTLQTVPPVSLPRSQ